MSSTEPKLTANNDTPETDSQLVAAIDLGSNSFHTVVARCQGNQLDIVDRHKETVRLAAGIDEHYFLNADAQQRALDCLQRISQLMSQVPNENIRAVGTNTLRRISNSETFLPQAEAALGTPIDIISGHEEARLIWLGVTKSLGDAPSKRLILDIGGGSTEFIYGEDHTPHELASLQIGCVRLTEKYFANGDLTSKAFKAARQDAMHELAPIQRRWRKFPWQTVIGTSGSAQAISLVLKENGLSDGTITYSGMREVRKLCIQCGNSQKLKLAGLSADREKVFAAGLAAMMGIFKALKIESMRTTETALREGVLYDLMGDRQGRELRHESVRALAKRHRLDSRHARRISKTARALLAQVANSWKLNTEIHMAYLHWAARLHELGLGIGFRSYHRHGAYIVDHSNMPGFSRQEQHTLGTLIQAHRKRIPLERLEHLTEKQGAVIIKLAILLRLAVYVHRDRAPKRETPIRIKAKGRQLTVTFKRGWLNRHPLTRADLEQEAARLTEAGFNLIID